MKRAVLILTGLLGILSAGKPHLGDSVKFYVNRFMLILYRDQVEKTGIVRYAGDNFTIVTPRDKIKINDIVRRNWINIAYPDSFDYFIATSNSDFYFSSRRKTGEYWEQQTQGIGATGAKDIYRILTNPASPQTVGNWSVVYFATDKGVYSQRQNVPPTGNFGKIAFIGEPVYSLIFHPDSTGPITSSGGIEILYAGTSNGVYKLRVRKNTVQYPDSLADVIPVDTLNNTVKALAVDPVDKSIYAGGEKLWHWTGSSWVEVSEVTAPVNEIKFINNILFVLTEDGLFYNDGTWNHVLQGNNLYDIEYAYNYYWISSLGNGVYRSNSPSSGWENINNGFEYLSNYGSLNCTAIYFDSIKNKLFVGNEQGIWQFDPSENKWKNKSRGIKNFVADYEVEQVKYVMEEYTGGNIFNKIKDVLKVKDEELWDMNADSVVHIILYKLEISGDTTVKIAKPLYGYFDEYDLDPSNSYASLKEIFVLNMNYDTTILYKDYLIGELKLGILAKYLAYLFGEYANWSIEHNESKPVRCGFSMLALHLAGFNIFNGTKNIGITPGRDWGSTVNRIAKSVFDYTRNWLRAPVSRELDRERMAYLFLYLREKLTKYFGNESSADSFIFKVMMRDKERDGKALFEYYLAKINSSFSEFIESWFLANLLDNYPEFNYYYEGVDSIFDYTNLGTFTREFTSSITTDILPPLTPRYLRKIDATDTLYYNLDFKDGFGDATYGFRVYRIDLVNKNITKIQFDTLKEYLNDTIPIINRAINTVSELLPPGSYYYAVLNTYGVDGYFAYSHDATPPSIYKKYIVQNPVFTNALDFYIVGEKTDLLYGDATATFLPFVILRPFDKKLPLSSFNIELSETGDSVAIYTASYTLPSSIKGDILVYSYAQDLVGNKFQIFYDTISVKKIEGGGIYTFLNDKIILEIPENSGFGGLVIATKLPCNYSDQLPSSCVYSIGHSNIVFSNPVKIKFYVGESGENLIVYKMENGKIVECETYKEQNYIYSYTNSLGVFILSNGKPLNLPGKFEVKIKSNMIPSNSPIKFSISIPYECDLRINLYDAIGRRIKEMDASKFSSGIYEFNLSSEKISKGVYFLEIDAKMKERFLKKYKIVIF